MNEQISQDAFWKRCARCGMLYAFNKEKDVTKPPIWVDLDVKVHRHDSMPCLLQRIKRLEMINYVR